MVAARDLAGAFQQVTDACAGGQPIGVGRIVKGPAGIGEFQAVGGRKRVGQQVGAGAQIVTCDDGDGQAAQAKLVSSRARSFANIAKVSSASASRQM